MSAFTPSPHPFPPSSSPVQNIRSQSTQTSKRSSTSITNPSPIFTSPSPLSNISHPSTSPSPPPLQTPEDRLNNLIRTINSVLHAYTLLPPTTQSPMFLNSLHEFHKKAYHLHPNPPLSPELPRSPINNTSSRIRRTNSTWNSPEFERKVNPLPGPRLEDVESLEKEWWNSEVVVAWYGPRPGIGGCCRPGRGGDVTKGRRRSDREPAMKREASYVGLHDE